MLGAPGRWVSPAARSRGGLPLTVDRGVRRWGGRQVHLGDLPASRSARRLAAGVWAATLPRLAALGAVGAAAAAAALLHALPGAPAAPRSAHRRVLRDRAGRPFLPHHSCNHECLLVVPQQADAAP